MVRVDRGSGAVVRDVRYIHSKSGINRYVALHTMITMACFVTAHICPFSIHYKLSIKVWGIN